MGDRAAHKGHILHSEYVSDELTAPAHQPVVFLANQARPNALTCHDAGSSLESSADGSIVRCGRLRSQPRDGRYSGCASAPPDAHKAFSQPGQRARRSLRLGKNDFRRPDSLRIECEDDCDGIRAVRRIKERCSVGLADVLSLPA